MDLATKVPTKNFTQNSNNYSAAANNLAAVTGLTAALYYFKVRFHVPTLTSLTPWDACKG